jgi:transglutaminase-like putative cysteine protease
MITFHNLDTKDQTGREMYRLIDQYSGDIHSIHVKGVPLSRLNLFDFFDFVRNIPYRKDIKGIEVVSRPAKIIDSKNVGMDCKKKSILISAYLKHRGIPFRLIASSKRPDKRIHHVFPQMKIDGKWLNMDATYKDYKPLELKTVTKAEVLKK